MKKRIIICICIVLTVLILISVYTVTAIITSSNTKGVEISGNYVDNDYNNVLSGRNLVRIGDTLYFTYIKSPTNYGLIKIDGNGVEKIYWEGAQPFNPIVTNFYIWKYNDKLVLKNADGLLQYYDSQSNSFKNYEQDQMPPPAFNCKIGDKNFFIDLPECVLCVDDGQKVTCTEINTSDIYPYEGYLYYTESIKSETSQKYLLKKYDPATDSTSLVCDLSYSGHVLDIYIEDGYVIIGGYDTINDRYGLYKLSLENPERGVEELITGDYNRQTDTYNGRINVYDGKVYVCSDKGLSSVSISDGSKTVLCNDNAMSCYIVDDYWVYFVGKDSSLRRVPQSGGKSEKVYSSLGW